jgi:hypothetical protein
MLDPNEVRKDGFRAFADRHHEKVEAEAAARNGKTPPAPPSPAEPAPDDTGRADRDTRADKTTTRPDDPAASAS